MGGQKSHPGARGGHAGPSHLQPPSHHGKMGMMDLEQEESGFAETLDSGITRGTYVERAEEKVCNFRLFGDVQNNSVSTVYSP